MIRYKSAARQLREEGYYVIPELLTGSQLDKLRSACDVVLERFTKEHDAINPGTDFMTVRHMNDSRWFSDDREPMRTILETISDPRCLGPVESVFGGPSLFRSIIYLVNPRYTSEKGNWHRDTQFIAKDEQEERELLRQSRQAEATPGVHLQLALADNDDLEIVPYSSGRYDSPEEAYIRLADGKSRSREDGMPNALRLSIKAGDGLIFNPYGLHRGRYLKGNPRRTLHITYTALFHEMRDEFTLQPWFDEEDYWEGLSPRATAYFRQYADTYRDYWRSMP